MAIETVGGVNQMLKSYSTEDWVKSASIEGAPAVDLRESITGMFPSDGKTSFSELLARSIGEVNDLQKEADLAVQRLVTGKSKNIHETMLAVERAEIAFKTMNQLRNKVIDAYREVMRMQV